MDAREALDGAAVNHYLVVEGLPELARGDGHVLELAEDVGELEPDELHVLVRDEAEDVFLSVVCHGKRSFQIKKGEDVPENNLGTPLPFDGEIIYRRGAFVKTGIAAL